MGNCGVKSMTEFCSLKPWIRTSPSRADAVFAIGHSAPSQSPESERTTPCYVYGPTLRPTAATRMPAKPLLGS